MSRDGSGAITTRRRLSAGILTAAALLFLILELRLIRSRGPIGWHAPDTIVSNGHAAQRLSVPFLRFLRRVRESLPPDASVAVLGPNAGTGWAPMDDLIAIGQLPRNDVVAGQTAVDGKSSPPRFLAVDRPGYADDRYRLIVPIGAGGLFERKR